MSAINRRRARATAYLRHAHHCGFCGREFHGNGFGRHLRAEYLKGLPADTLARYPGIDLKGLRRLYRELPTPAGDVDPRA